MPSVYFQFEYYVGQGKGAKKIIMNANTPPKDYLLTINVIGEDRCYLGFESSSNQKMLILGNSLLKPFHLFYSFYDQSVGFAVGIDSAGSISEGSNTIDTIWVILTLAFVFGFASLGCLKRER